MGIIYLLKTREFVNSEKNVFGTPPNVFDLDEVMKKINSTKLIYKIIQKMKNCFQN